MIDKELAAENFLILTTTGRKSGDDHEVTLCFYYDQGLIYLLAHSAREKSMPDWAWNLKASEQCRLELDGNEFTGKLISINDSKKEKFVKSGFIKKYGQDFYDTWYADGDRKVVVIKV